MVLDGKVLADTGWVLRDPKAWWNAGDLGTRPRAAKPSLLVGHWTAGRPLTGERTARTVVSNMKARKRDDGTPLEVGIHFVISWDGLVFQTADLGVATVHVGNRDTIKRSIGVETAWPGTVKQANKLQMAGVTGTNYVVAGENVRVAEPAKALLSAWVRLAEALAGVAGVNIPKKVPGLHGDPRRTRFTPSEALAWRGAQEHFHVPPPTTKVDAAGVLIQALADAGWAVT
jgi:hypothetical protein